MKTVVRKTSGTMKTWRRELSPEPPNCTSPRPGVTMHMVIYVNGVPPQLCSAAVVAEGIIKGLPEAMAFGQVHLLAAQPWASFAHL